MPARRVSGAAGEAGAESSRSRGKEGKEKETFGCPYPGCGQSYSRMEYLKRHQRKHQDVRPFQCKDCSKSFARSDVLLRHRRRCHPTPPPADRSSRSPPPMHRGYPSVPISSSRNDDAEAATSMRGRKHPRQISMSDPDGQDATRRKLNSDEDEDFESAHFRQNGMGNGGVYNGMNSYYGTSAESSTYTPHLLPMFQQAPFPPTYPPDPEANHLEDASVLLSMAYGASQEQQPPTVQGQQVVANDWGPAASLSMIDTDKPISGGSNGSIANNEVTGNFLAAMNWLGGVNKGSSSGEGAEPNYTLSPKAPSPFPFSNFFSPSAFNVNGLPDDKDATADEPINFENNEAVMNILNQLAQYEVPQTKLNPNPERPLLRLAHEDLVQRAGPETDINSRFHLPADRFAGCYQIPHWALPSLKTLSLMANRTFDTVLNHFSFVHTPTFKLTDTAACLAFAICTIGGIRSSKQKWDHLLRGSDFAGSQSSASPPQISLDGPVPPGNTWESMYQRNFMRGGPDDDDVKQVDGWENGHVVRNEKTNMLVKSFSLAQGVLMTEYNVALLQALILYHAPFFLSESESERALANMFLGTIVNITRQIGFFTQELDHFKLDIIHPEEQYTANELDLHWRRWIQLETRRRTAFLVFHLDTVSAIESNIPCILSPCELSYLPLPAPDSLWKAETAEVWLKAVRNYQPMTLDEAMRRTFFLPTYGAFDALHEKADTKYYHLLNKTELGPFARASMVVSLLRGIMDIGEGKRDRGDWRDLTDLWLTCTWLRPGKKMLDSTGQDIGEPTEESLRDRFAQGLQRWREGWDFDPTCPSPVTGLSSSNNTPSSTTSPGSDGSDGLDKRLNYCEEALPYYWLAQALLNILKQAPPHEPGWNVFAPGPGNNMQGVKYGEMLKSARMFTRMGEGMAGLPTMSSTAPSTGFTPAATTATGPASTVSTGLPDMSLGQNGTFDPLDGPGQGLAGTGDGDAMASDSVLNGITFEDFLSGLGGQDIMAS